jgi:hypothetical protein
VNGNTARAPSERPDLCIIDFATLLQEEAIDRFSRRDYASAEDVHSSALLALSE